MELKIRYVAKEMKWWEQRDDLFTPDSLGATARLVDFYALHHGYSSFRLLPRRRARGSLRQTNSGVDREADRVEPPE